MRVLVGYATAFGSTQEIAERIGAKVAAHGAEVLVRPFHESGDALAYDAAVLGSPIHHGRWLPEAVGFVHDNEGVLRERPVWFFTASSLGETSSFFAAPVAWALRRMWREGKDMAPLRAAVHPRDHRRFAGVIGPDQWGRVGNLILRVFGGRFGDHRDWGDIEQWAEGIGRDVAAWGSSSRGNAGH